MDSRRTHWDNVYARKAPGEVSWFEPEPAMSLRMLDAAGLAASS